MSTPNLDSVARQRLQQLIADTRDDYKTFIGFPGSLDFDFSPLAPATTLLLNNVGDPSVDTWHGLHTKALEREVITFCAELFRAPRDDYWGYVTSGGTESNLYALYLAREKLPKAVVYYSEAAHYGVPKNAHLLRLSGQVVRTLPSGEMDYDDLAARLAEHPDRPAIVVATIGTTMTEARDNVLTIREMLESRKQPYYIHADAALTGVYAALLSPRHPFDFQDGADSISVSGHKFFGAPMPCGVIVVRKSDREVLRSALNYTGSADTTISGSRNGHTPLFLWYVIQSCGIEGLRKRATDAQAVAAYAHDCLHKLGWESWRNPGALTVMLASPPLPLAKKWQLATHNGWSHIICMPGITTSKIDRFMADLERTQTELGGKPTLFRGALAT